MTWKRSISLEAANKLFESFSISFSFDEVEESYIAARPNSNRTIRRAGLMVCAIAVLKEWFSLRE